MDTNDKTPSGSILEETVGIQVPEEPSHESCPEHHGTIVIGGGQAGLSVGYHLAKRGVPFIILDAGKRIGDVWRNRWDSLHLFTPAAYDGLDGMPFPAHPHAFPSKDEMAAYLESYAERFNLPVRNGVTVDGLSRQEDGCFVVTAGGLRMTADNVVVAMSNYQRPKVPAFASDLDPEIVQLHSFDYRNPAQLREGNVLIVGAGNSGAEIAKDLVQTHAVWMSGRDTGHLPFRITSAAARYIFVPLVLRFLFHRVFTVSTPIGRRVRAGSMDKGGPLIRVLPKDLAAMGVKRVARVVGVKGGLPVLEDNQVVDVTNIIWCTGYHPNFSWINLPIFDHGDPAHERGIVPAQPGLYFCGLHFLYAMSSVMVQGVGRDAERVARAVAAVKVVSSKR